MKWVGIFQVGRNFLRGSFPGGCGGGGFPGESLMGGNFPCVNFPGGSFPRTIETNRAIE